MGAVEEAAAEAPPPGGRGQSVGEAGEGGGPPAAAPHPGPGSPASPTTFAYESTEIDISVLNALPASLATEVRMSMLTASASIHNKPLRHHRNFGLHKMRSIPTVIEEC